MSTGRLDTYIPDYMSNVAVINGTSVNGAFIPLWGATGFTIQAVCTNGAAGTLYLNATNTWGIPALTQSNGLPYSEYLSQQNVGANGHAGMKVSITDNVISFQGFWIAFAPSASGNIYIAVNVRRLNS